MILRMHGKRARCSADSREKYQLGAHDAGGLMNDEDFQPLSQGKFFAALLPKQ